MWIELTKHVCTNGSFWSVLAARTGGYDNRRPISFPRRFLTVAAAEAFAAECVAAYDCHLERREVDGAGLGS